jgi:signal transduction histidine kinase/DNA-binding response OmpR family regulator
VAVEADERGDAADERHERLGRDLAEAREQLAATGEVLTALGRSASDLDGILGTVVEGARRLCRAAVAQIHLVDGDFLRLARSTGLSKEGVAFMAEHPVGPDRGSLIGRVRLYGRTQQITDVLADPDYGRFELQGLAGLRTVLGVPMLLDDELVGVLLVWRTEVDPFGDHEADVLTTFAAQAAVAIRQVDLRRALEARQAELAQKVDQLEALGEVAQAVSSSLDLDLVLETIITHAVQLSGTDGGSIFEFDEAAEAFLVRTAYGTSAGLVDALRHTHIGLHETLVGRAAMAGRPYQVADLRDAPLDPHLERLRDAGWRSLVAVPMLREDRIVGALVVRRRTPGSFSEETCELLQTLANQSALAILNARLFRELERKSAELEVASQHKSEFLASMSHELRTPLNAVIGFSEVLLERMFGDLNERQEEYLHDILGSGKHLLDLLNDILDLSKVEAGRMELERSTFSVRQTMDYGLSLMRERALRQAVTLRLDVAPGVGLVEADELRFKQVVLNLLSNAVKFTPAGGEVVVRAAADGAELVVSVSDTGIGVPPEDRERIFESFQQGGRAATQQEGTGLGLTLCRRIVDLLGGRMWLDSEQGKGSTFSFAIPLGAPVSAGRRTAKPQRRGEPLVVVIEDDRRSLELLMLYLQDAGVAVVDARDGPEGLDAVRRLGPSAVVLDIRLPGMDGWDVLAALKADPATATVPVVVVSMLDERGRGFALGAAEYLVKPVSREDVLSALARVRVLPDTARTLLAIDDDPLAVELVKAVLESDGWTVLSATDGEAGLAIARSRLPSVVLLDLLMPDMDGFAVVEALRSEPVTRAIPIVVLTSKTMTAADKDRLHGQISYVAQKGKFDPANLVDLVHRATGAHATSPSAAP